MNCSRMSDYDSKDKLIKVKVSCGNIATWNILIRQLPSRLPILNNTEFIFSKDVDHYDYWVVVHNESVKVKETAYCNPKNVIYISMEPTERVGFVSNKFLQQFATLVLTDPDIKFNNVIRENIHSWWVGIGVVNSKNGHQFKKISLDYDSLTQLTIPENKLDRISVLLSNKSTLEGHIKRKRFVSKLLNSSLGRYIDVYGDGYIPVLDKMDIILPYKYHICIENCNVPNYWSEKLADAFLGFSLPIYYGHSSITNYFSEDSMLIIDIDNPEESIDKIHRLISCKSWDKKVELVAKSRLAVLNKYNMFNFISNVCSSKSNDVKSKVCIYPAYYFRLNPVLRTFKMIYNYFKID